MVSDRGWKSVISRQWTVDSIQHTGYSARRARKSEVKRQISKVKVPRGGICHEDTTILDNRRFTPKEGQVPVLPEDLHSSIRDINLCPSAFICGSMVGICDVDIAKS
jgi:hypothetical protein